LNESRPWGSYETLAESDSYKIKIITVNPSSRLSLQRHQKRSEHWFIIEGESKVTINGKDSYGLAGAVYDIPAGSTHRIENIGTSALIFSEVQTGTYFGEDDIERLSDDYGR
jgi:mannose-6-phosphate isomerase